MALRKSDIRAIIKNQDATDEERLAEILDLFHSEVDLIKGEKDQIQSELDEANRKLNQGAEEVESEWKNKFDSVNSEFEKYKAQIENEKAEQIKKNAFIEQLKDAGIDAKYISKIVKLTDFKEMELDENGELKDLEALKEQIKTEWAEVIPEVETTGANTQTPPNVDEGEYKTKEEILAIKDSTERQKAILENHNLFGF